VRIRLSARKEKDMENLDRQNCISIYFEVICGNIERIRAIDKKT
jgi:hypothetical protein